MKLNSKGFTLVELVLAMAVFSFMLLIISAGFLNVVRLQQSGTSYRNTSQGTRFGMEEIVRNTRDASAIIYPLSGTDSRLCIVVNGSVRQYWVVLSGQDQDALAEATECNPTTTSYKVMTSRDVKVTRFQVTKIEPSTINGKPGVELELDLANNNGSVLVGSSCDQTVFGAHFCSVSKVRSAVTLRGIGE